mmetsp:Transcript_21430/g.50390  ORF Transcript_21430/g.50390 Transcript_21430/m.50390 type:complete len:339 (-) Transcript_21430:1035-2051(-)
MAEGTALNVLPTQAHVVALVKERAEGESFRGAPVNAVASGNHCAACLEHSLEAGVDVEAFRDSTDGDADLLEKILFDAGVADGPTLRLVEPSPLGIKPFTGLGCLEVGVLGAVPGLVERRQNVGLDFLELLLRVGAGLDKLLLVDLQRRRVSADLLIHQGLSVRGLVNLVVAVAAIAHNVDDNALAELLAVHGSCLAHEVHSLDIVSVHVEDRRVDSLGHIRAVGRGARETRVRGEANLVVHDNVDGATSLVLDNVGKLHGFVHNTLASEGGVTVEKNAHSALALVISEVKVLSGSLAFNHGVDELQMRGVGDQRHVHALARQSGAAHGSTEMVLHVA